MHEVLVNLLGGLSLPRKSVARLTDRPNMNLDVYRGRKTTTTTTVLCASLSRQTEGYRKNSEKNWGTYLPTGTLLQLEKFGITI